MSEEAKLSRRAQVEQEKYEAIYRHRGQNAFNENHGASSRAVLNAYNPTEVLDLGSGSGAYARGWADSGVDVTAVDISREAFKHPNYDHPRITTFCRSLDDLTGIRTHQVVTSFDCFEHLHPKMVPDALRHLARVTGEMAMLNISYIPSVNKGPNGEELHLTVRTGAWWVEKLKKAYGKGWRIQQNGDYIIIRKSQ